jgi:hypothetical protein
MAGLGSPNLVAERNVITYQKHRREVFWQIALPLILGLLLLITGCVLPVLVVVSGNDVRVWADISLIWLILPVLILAVIPLAILVAIIYGLTRILNILPGLMNRVQKLFGEINVRVSRASNSAVDPILRFHSFTARIRVLRHFVRKR